MNRPIVGLKCNDIPASNLEKGKECLFLKSKWKFSSGLDEESRTVSISRSNNKVKLNSEDSILYRTVLSAPHIQQQDVKNKDDFDENAEIVTFQDAACLQKNLGKVKLEYSSKINCNLNVPYVLRLNVII